MSADPLAETRLWVERMVVGLGLCPFAAAPLRGGEVRFVLSEARTPSGIVDEILAELERLEGPEGPNTTLLVIPKLLRRLDEFLDLAAAIEDLIEQAGYEGFYQLASFHPDFRYGDALDDPADEVGRSPYPTLHLLRWEEVRRASETHPDVEGIPARNARLLRSLGAAGVRRAREGA